MDNLIIYGFAIIGFILVLVIFGLIGPKWLRDKMRSFNRWAWKSNISPANPYKPVDKDDL